MGTSDDDASELLDGFMVTESFDDRARREVFTYESEEVADARNLDRLGRQIDVLVLVKTTPQPSKKYVDTVCVAGLASNPLRWVRLYPVPFRYLEADNQFPKYSTISVRVHQSESDRRIESLKVDASTITSTLPLSTERGWEKRAEKVEPIGDVTLCDLITQARRDHDAPSLGMVRPQAGTFELEVSEHPGWSDAQRARLEEHAAAGDQPIFGDTGPRTSLEAPPLKIWVKFKCDAECAGHRLQFIDWEPTTLMRRKQSRATNLEAVVRERFEDNPARQDKDLRIFVGNQHDVTRRASFQALGLYYPTKTAADSARFNTPLF